MRSAQSLPELAPPVEVAAHRGDLEALAAAWDGARRPAAPWRRVQVMGVEFRLVEDLFHRQGTVCPRRARRPAPSSACCRCARSARRSAAAASSSSAKASSAPTTSASSAARADEERLAAAFARHLGHEPFDELCLDGILRGDALLPALEGVLPASRSEVEPRYKCPHVTLAGDFERYLGELPDGTGPQWKRRLRWLEKRPGFAIERLTDPAALVARPRRALRAAPQALGDRRRLRRHRLARRRSVPPPRRPRARRARPGAPLSPAGRRRAARRALRLRARRSLRVLPGRLRSRMAPALRRHRAARPRRQGVLRRRAQRIRFSPRQRALQAQVGQRLARDGAVARARCLAARARSRRRPHGVLAAARRGQTRAATERARLGAPCPQEDRLMSERERQRAKVSVAGSARGSTGGSSCSRKVRP